MTLIKSISGIRGTIGGNPGDNLTPFDIVKYSTAFGTWLKENKHTNKSIVIGRDARMSGDLVSQLVMGTLQAQGFDVIDLGLSTTPTVEIAVAMEKAAGGIILTASHNPKEWNALKLLNSKGEFISAEAGEKLLEYAEDEQLNTFADIEELGRYLSDDSYIDKHIDAILELPLVDVEAIKKANFKVAIDCVNSTGGISLPPLLKALGVNEVTEFFCDPNGIFPHNPEPLPENIVNFTKEFTKGRFDLGIVVDPDVDRLAFVCEEGTPFGEEYTLVAIADYVLSHTPGPTASNLSSTLALKDITEKHGQVYHASAVGEVNVVKTMKAHNAVIGGEGNGGIIYPKLHAGRDALVGIALFLTHLAQAQMPMTKLKETYPTYHISKNKIALEGLDLDNVLAHLKEKYKDQPINTIDGVKILFDKSWVHLRKSNTEPIIRIYAEAETKEKSEALAQSIIDEVNKL